MDVTGDFLLRRFKPSDLDQVMYINRVCLPENYPPEFFLNLYKSFPETFVVAEKGGEIVGYIMCRIESGLFDFLPRGTTRRGHVISIAVLPEYRHQGIGRAMMEKAMHAMKLEYEAKKCYLEVRVTNTQAIEFYKGMGFKISQTIKGYYIDGCDAYILEKEM